MYEKSIKCFKCGKEYPLSQTIFRCEKCGDSLEITYDYAMVRRNVRKETFAGRPFLHERYIELFPVKKTVSAGEGGTPLIRSRNLERELRLPFEVWFKLEMQNPSGSFKDRGSSVEIARAVEQGAKSVVCASTGNMGASVSAYSGMVGLPCSIFTPKDAAEIKLQQIMAYGANVYQIEGDYTAAAKLVEEAFRQYGHYLLGDYLFRREGTKSIGFEIAEQLPDAGYVFCPVGNGTLISATGKAYREFREIRILKDLPKLVGIQAKGCDPVTTAFKTGQPIKPMDGKTLAVAMECGDPLDGLRALQTVKESGGFAEEVTDKEILEARVLLARREGIFTEPGGAASFAGLLKHRDKLKRETKVVCLITGHGLKEPRTGFPGEVKKVPAGATPKDIFGVKK